MANSFTNSSIDSINSLLAEYYSSLFEEVDKTEKSSYKTPYFFDIMKDIKNVDNTDFKFNQFIKQCVYYTIGTDGNNNDMLDIITTGNNADTDKINDAHTYIYTVCSIIDILEAYKNYIDTNKNYLTSIPAFVSIKLSKGTTNTGSFNKDTKTLDLKIQSFPANSETSIFTKAANGNYQIVNKIDAVYISPTDGDALSQSQSIIKNLLYFLLNISSKNAKVEVYCLYYYYEVMRCYILLTCASTNIAINDMSSTGRIHGIKFDTSSTIYVSDDYNADSDSRTPADILSQYTNTRKFVFDKLVDLQNNFTVGESRLLVNKAFNFNIDPVTDEKTTSIVLKYTGDDIVTINDSILTEYKKKDLIDNYYIYNNNKYYKITSIDTNTNILTITAKYASNSDINYRDIPTLPSNITVADGGVISGSTFVESNFVTLKKDYYDNKDNLYDINNSIKTNTLKLNTVKHKYEYNKNMDDTLNTQIMAIHIILGIIAIVFTGVIMSNIDNELKKQIIIVIAGLILLVIIVIYILNSKSKVEEGFAVVIDDDGLLLADTTSADKINYLNSKYTTFNAQVEIFFNVMKTYIKNVDSVDIYDDLLNIMDREKYEKQNIANLIGHKSSLGKSHIDVYKYDYFNKQIYINTILVSALSVITLYIVYTMNPKIEKNLLVFIGIIVLIIIMAYYIINTNMKVHSNSSMYYWSPMDINKR
jgi:undecaprenyl pyrophosphate phosphatase UppP